METVEVVIRLKKERYDELQKNKHLPNRLDIEKAITDGTVLSKGHGRLKDENEIKQMIEDARVKNEYSKNFAENIIKFAPTVIEADTDGE